jgi:hypothetical protein
VLGFPFETLGIFALIVLTNLAATSHGFWLSFLTPPVWKALHLRIHPAYAAMVGHVALGYLQDARNPAFAMVVAAGALTVAGLARCDLPRRPHAVGHRQRLRASGRPARRGLDRAWRLWQVLDSSPLDRLGLRPADRRAARRA